MEGARRKRTIPAELRGPSFTRERFYEWARTELNGQVAAQIDKRTLEGIRQGAVTEVWLQTRKHGFFAPNGEFIEAFEHRPSFGDDLDKSEKEWELEEKNNAWADEENARFNKKTVVKERGIGRALWEHGKRIEEHASSSRTSAANLIRILDRRKTADAYARHTHQTCLDFFRWKQKLDEGSPVADWTWERIDAVLRFSNRNDVRDVVEVFLLTSLVRRLSDKQVTTMLGIKTRSKGPNIETGRDDPLADLRTCLKEQRLPETSLVSRVLTIVVPSS
jgi:hypothetical protein